MSDPSAAPTEPIELKAFLENVPPGKTSIVAGTNWGLGANRYRDGTRDILMVPPPTLRLHCGNPACQDSTYFDTTAGKPNLYTGDPQPQFWAYVCRHCRQSAKTFALLITATESEATIFKIGEFPQFGPPLSARLLQVAGDQIQLLKKGRQCENQGLGIGAFAYYRRVVELQKGRLIDEIERAMQRLGASAETLKPLQDARQETQFSKAIDMIAAALPKELFISGQNPLTLLHGPLSVGLHAESDQTCLKFAHSVRTVLEALLERVAEITRDSADLAAAIKHLATGLKKAAEPSE